MAPTAKQIGDWLRKARQRARIRARREGKRDFSVEKAARRVDVGEKTLRLWEKGINPPPADKMLLLVESYDANIAELVAPAQPKTTAEEKADLLRRLAELEQPKGKGRRAGGAGR